MKPMKKKIARLDELAARSERLTQQWKARHPEFATDAETLRSWREGIEWDRKAIHLLATVFALVTNFVADPYASAALLAVTLFVLAVDASRLGMRRWALVVYRLMPYVFRADEQHRLSGASVMMIGIFLTSACFPAPAATAGILCLVWGDSAAALVGQFYAHWRRMRQGRRDDTIRKPAVRKRSRKTVAGTLGCLIVSMGMITIAVGWRPDAIIYGALAASLMERWTHGRWDNLTIPLVSAGIIHVALNGWTVSL